MHHARQPSTHQRAPLPRRPRLITPLTTCHLPACTLALALLRIVILNPLIQRTLIPPAIVDSHNSFPVQHPQAITACLVLTHPSRTASNSSTPYSNRAHVTFAAAFRSS
ncbi:MAG: hypothetical protein FRX48_06108 [Lasallia pustulata]|uniref:Uncharacterized protein n=1 Tax=Lasallia pustulata TaxID=136370 RepID=A0A5M8PMF8_9LECA|nr:MAG: hypothetical protein FRX48_06108 [Lasallia pustulata]